MIDVLYETFTILGERWHLVLLGIDQWKIALDKYCKYGIIVNVKNLFNNRHADQFEKIGPVFQFAYWMVVREVSGAAPAPHDTDDDTMNMWLNTVYYYLQHEYETMEVCAMIYYLL